MMEEAYAQLYQEFLRLRSLCLRQASLLQQLTTALKQQQGATNGDLSDILSLPAQFTSEIPVYLNSPKLQPTFITSAPRSVQGPSGNMGTFSDLLAEDMSKLYVETAAPSHRTDVKSDLSVPYSLTSNMTLSHGADHSVINADLNSANATLSGAGCPSHCGLQTQSNGLMMMMTMMNSDVALQSHVCEFCHAVFPGDTTTRGEYLRHLHTHIT